MMHNRFLMGIRLKANLLSQYSHLQECTLAMYSSTVKNVLCSLHHVIVYVIVITLQLPI